MCRMPYVACVADIRRLKDVPSVPAVYAMYGSKQDGRPAYVGVAGKLKSRLRQHLVLRDSSVTTGASVVALNPELVRVVAWWEHPSFDEKGSREAAELIAAQVLNPVLTSRGTSSSEAQRRA